MKNLLNFVRNDNLNEIVFANRNKEYGAYVLRNEEGQVLKKALFIGISIVFTIAVVPLLFNSTKPITVIPPEVPPFYLDPVEVVDTPVNPVNNPPQQAKEFDSQIPTPAQHPRIEKLAPAVTKYDGAVPGFADTPGEKPVIPYVAPASVPGIGIETVIVPEKITDPNEIRSQVDVEAQFTGGLDAFRNKVAQNLDPSDFAGTGERIKATVVFVVEKDGSISQIKATGPNPVFNKEAERSVRSVKSRWVPAKVNGAAVRSYYKIPITMQFE